MEIYLRYEFLFLVKKLHIMVDVSLSDVIQYR